MTHGRLALLTLGVVALVAARPPMHYQPDPSSVIAAEIAFNRLAQSKGQWTAFRETAASDAIMFVPQRVIARDWLKKQVDPPVSVTWSPSVAYVSCDGRTAATTGNWRRADGSAGYFTTIWRRDKKGAWQWVLDHGDRLEIPRPTPEYLTGKVATCRAPGRPIAPPAQPGKDAPAPADESLLWTVDIMPDNGHRVTVSLWNGAGYDVVIDDRVKAAP